MARPSVHAGFEAAAVEAGQSLRDLVGKERVVAGGDERLGDGPDFVFGGHPVELVEAREVDGDGVGAEGALAAQVVVVVEVAEGQLAEGAVDGCAETETGEVGFGDAAPELALAIDGEDMVVVVDGFEIDEERRMTVDAKSGSGQERAFEAVALALAKDTLRGTGGVSVLVGEGVDELLDFGGGVEGAQGAVMLGREAEALAGVARVTVGGCGATVQGQGWSARGGSLEV